MTASKYGNRLHHVCRDCGLAIPMASSTPEGAIQQGEVWLTPGGELLATEALTVCPSCGADWHGFVADSGAEARRYGQLLLMQRAGEIAHLTVHPRYTILHAFRDRDGRHHEGIEYEADFAYTEKGLAVVEDVKGAETQVWKIKRSMFLRYCQQYQLRVIPAGEVE